VCLPRQGNASRPREGVRCLCKDFFYCFLSTRNWVSCIYWFPFSLLLFCSRGDIELIICSVPIVICFLFPGFPWAPFRSPFPRRGMEGKCLLLVVCVLTRHLQTGMRCFSGADLPCVPHIWRAIFVCMYGITNKLLKSKLRYDRRSVGQSVFVSSPHQGPKTRFLFLSDSCGFVHVGRPLTIRREGRSVDYTYCWSSLAQSYIPRSNLIVHVIYIYNFTCQNSTYSVAKSLVPCGHLLFTVFHVTVVITVVAICTMTSRPVAK
jgi:hypothetical protein